MVGSGGEVVVVGGSAAGLRCACRLARLRPDVRVTVVEQAEVFSYAACGMPYVLSGDVEGAAALRRTLDGSLRDEGYFESAKGVKVLPGRRATVADLAGRRLTVVDRSGAEEHLRWDELVIATGARPRRLPNQPDHPRVRSLHVLDDLEPLHAGLASGRFSRVAIIGAGAIGCELAEAFRALWGCSVVLVEAGAHPLPALLDADLGSLVAEALRQAGVELRCGQPVGCLRAGDDGVELLVGAERVPADVALVAVGVEPVVDLASAAGVEIGETGAIRVDARMATSVPHVWAVGDCVEHPHRVSGRPVHLPLGGLANRAGRVLGTVLAGGDDHVPPVVGAAAVKVFDTNVAAAGLTLRAAGALGLDARAVWLIAHDRAHYWPEAKEIALSLVYERGSGRLLGVQAAGPGEVAKRVDVASALLAHGAVLADLAHMEHAYAPPFAPALEPLAVAAMVAQNQEEGVESLPPLADLAGLTLLDVRRPDEREKRPLEAPPAASGAAPDVVICERGARAAQAARAFPPEERPVYLGGGLRLREMAGKGRK